MATKIQVIFYSMYGHVYRAVKKEFVMRSPAIAAIGCVLAFSASAFAADLKSVSQLAFGPDSTLFVADWRDARVHALSLPPAAAKRADETFNVVDLETALAKLLRAGRFSVEDMAVRPGTGEVYLAVSVGAEKAPTLIVVTSDQKMRRVDLKKAESTSIALKDATTSDYKFWDSIPERSFTVTDMKWHDGELFVAGLSNQDFASTLRRIPYPFTDQQAMTSVEIFHTTHNQIETRAPIRAMTFADLDGKLHLLAAYTCTPLVTIPLEDLKDGAHIRGKAIAELGYGNTPAAMVSYRKTEQGKVQDMVLVVNYERVSNIIPVAQIAAASAKPGIDKPVPIGQITGVEAMQAPLVGVMRVDNLDDRFFVAVRRQLESDALQLVTFEKNLAFRLSDHVAEYNFPQYSYQGDQLKFFKPLQDMLKKQEGFPDRIKPSTGN